MPGMDGTGPAGLGPGIGFRRGVHGAGKGWGPGMYCGCGYGYGCGSGYGYWRGYGSGYCWAPADTKEALQARKEFLKSELAVIDQELESI